jgi:uncharacterized protein YjbJ (UPF0337 family)
MNNEGKGKLDNLKGRMKQAVGAALGNKKMEAEGAAERAKGAAQEKVGEAERKLAEERRRANANAIDDEDDEA